MLNYFLALKSVSINSWLFFSIHLAINPLTKLFMFVLKSLTKSHEFQEQVLTSSKYAIDV